MGLFDSVVSLVKDVGSIVASPVEMAVDLISVPVKEVVEVVNDLKEGIKSLKD